MPADLQALLITGFQAHRDGQLEAAESAYRTVLAADPEHAEAMHLLGLVAMHRGDRAGAVALMTEAAARLPALAMVHFNLGNALLASDRETEAVAAFAAALRADPEHHAARSALVRTQLARGRAGLADGRVDEGLAHLTMAAAQARGADQLDEIGILCHPHDTVLGSRIVLRAWTLAPTDGRLYENVWHMLAFLGRAASDIPAFEAACRTDRDYAALIGLANALRAAMRLTEAEHVLREAITLAPAWPFARSRLACLLASQHRYREADALFQHIAARHPGRESAVRLSADFIRALPAEAPAEPPVGPPVVRDGDADIVILASCDAVYFARFGAALARSVRRNAGVRARLHVHIVNPDAASAALMDTLVAELGGAWIAFTAEHRDPASFGGEPRTYYACARYLQLPALLARSGVPVLVLDVDTLVLRDLAPFLASLHGTDLALVGGEDKRFEIWNTYWAGLVYLAATEAARDFADQVRRYVRHFLARGEGRWFLDQIALYAVLAQGFRDRPAPATVLLPTDIRYNRVPASDDTGGPPPHCLFWSIHASGAAVERALATPLFRQFTG